MHTVKYTNIAYMTTSPLTSLASNMIMASPESVAVWESIIETDIPVYFLNPISTSIPMSFMMSWSHVHSTYFLAYLYKII